MKHMNYDVGEIDEAHELSYTALLSSSSTSCTLEEALIKLCSHTESSSEPTHTALFSYSNTLCTLEEALIQLCSTGLRSRPYAPASVKKVNSVVLSAKFRCK
jgi:hypothetical protein